MCFLTGFFFSMVVWLIIHVNGTTGDDGELGRIQARLQLPGQEARVQTVVNGDCGECSLIAVPSQVPVVRSCTSPYPTFRVEVV